MTDRRATPIAELTSQVASRVDTAASHWLSGEVVSVVRTPYGAAWVELEDDTARCKLYVEPKPMRAAGQRLGEGAEIRVRARARAARGRPSWHWRVVWLEVLSDRSARAVARDGVIATLHDEGVIDSTDLAAVHFSTSLGGVVEGPVRRLIALVPTWGNEGWGDVADTLPSDVVVDVRRVSSSGQTMAGGCAAELAKVSSGDADAVLITRGGGDPAELRQFDDPALARAISSCPVPVLTALGHSANRSVADLAAARAFQTPTAAGQAIAGSVRRAQGVRRRRDEAGALRRDLVTLRDQLASVRAERDGLGADAAVIVNRLREVQADREHLQAEADGRLLADARSRVHNRLDRVAASLVAASFLIGAVGQSADVTPRWAVLAVSALLSVLAILAARGMSWTRGPVAARRAHMVPVSPEEWRSRLPGVRSPRQLQLFERVPERTDRSA